MLMHVYDLKNKIQLFLKMRDDLFPGQWQELDAWLCILYWYYPTFKRIKHTSSSIE